MLDSAKQRILRALDALASCGWTVARARSGLLEIPSDAYPQLAVDQEHFDEPFSDDGELVDDLHFVRHGPRPDLQVAFARQRLCVALTDDENEDFRIERRRMSTENDLMMLFEVLAALEAEGYAVGAGVGDTPSHAWEQMGDRQHAVLWTREAHRHAFDRVGRMTGRLALAWRGDPERILAAFHDTVFDVEPPIADDDTFIIST